jgi:S1-C subfamily serine protease/mono/diheme cytochrome c family protein
VPTIGAWRGVRLAAVVLFLGVAVPSRAAEPRIDAGRLVFLLEYVGTDYSAAVRNGNVISTFEYGEVLRFTKQIIREYEARQKRPDDVSRGLREVQELIERRAAAPEVFAATRRVLPGLAKALGATEKPGALPNLASGRRLWISDCAPCHGPGGAGDGNLASGMEPPPTAFRGELIERISPRQIYNAVTFGVDGTAMPSFSPAYTERQRWDVAFFVMTLRLDFAPKRVADGVGFALEELATSSNGELLARLREKRPDATKGEVDWFRANFSAPGGNVPFAGPEAAGSAVSAALQIQEVFADVADRIMPRVVGVTGYMTDHAPPDARSSEGWSTDAAGEFRYPGFHPGRAGTGFLVDDEGYVLTCDHLVRTARGELVEFADVELQNQLHLEARIVGTEPTLDLAVLQVADATRTTGPAALEFGDSDRLQLGQWVIAVGDPPGVGKTFAVGLVSAPPERQCYQAERSATRVQSSLIVPSGGIGGPIADVLGHVIGMSVRQPGPPELVPGDGPAATHVLPINLVLNLYEALKVAQSKESPWIGVSVLELALLRRRLGAKARSMAIPETGVYIDDVFDPSPASRAGIVPGDFLLALGGHRLLSVGDFQTWLYVLGFGKEIELVVQRDGRQERLTVPIEVRPQSATSR